MAEQPKPKRRRRTKDEIAAALFAAQQAKVVLWAETHGAPVRLLDGWNPETGQWGIGSPVGMMLALVQGTNFPTTAARVAGVPNLSSLLAKGNEYMIDQPEDRKYIPLEVLPFIDLVRQMELAEGFSETELVKTVQKEARKDAKLALAFLSRRFGARWREQQAIFTGEEIDERDAAVSAAITDPNVASQLADVAHAIEDRVPHDVD